MGQVQTLFLEPWIAIHKFKGGPSNHKAFLTREGTKLIQDRGKYFKFMFHFKNKNSYIFTIEYSNKSLQHKNFTNIINKFIKESAKKIKGQPTLFSNSFQIGFILKLWSNTSDIEFIR